MNTYTWKIHGMIVTKQLNGQQNVVSKISWACHGTNGTQRSFRKDVCEITFDQNSSFTPYENLTEQEVLSWLWNSIDKNAIESAIDQSIENQINPPYANLPLPWNNNEPI